jgi:pimeloyl-ACP methyl ester carboxylesterase
MGAALVSDLASHGYVVVAIGHTYDAEAIAFPDGRVEVHRPDVDIKPHLAVARRRMDAQLVLDKLDALAAGTNPDGEHRALPAGLRGRLDMTRVGMFGHSLGGAATAQTIAHDRRVVAGINLDGSFFPEDIDPITASPEQMDAALDRIAARIDRPLMIMGDSGRGPDDFGAMIGRVWHGLRSWARFISLIGSTHGSYTDHEWMLDQLAAAGVIPSATSWIGTGRPDRIIAAERAYIGAFFDLWLRGSDSHLLDGPSPDYPEARYFPHA